MAADEKRIDIRSASRVGRSDLGANRDRVEKIRKAFQQASAERNASRTETGD